MEFKKLKKTPIYRIYLKIIYHELKSHPELDAQLEICPFNALHRYMPRDKVSHILECPDKERVFNKRSYIQGMYNSNLM